MLVVGIELPILYMQGKPSIMWATYMNFQISGSISDFFGYLGIFELFETTSASVSNRIRIFSIWMQMEIEYRRGYSWILSDLFSPLLVTSRDVSDTTKSTWHQCANAPWSLFLKYNLGLGSFTILWTSSFLNLLL